MKQKTLGDLGENFVADLLIAKGYYILQKKYSCRFGEIDVIAFKDEIIYFVEVKTRQSIEFGYPSEAVDDKKKRAIEFTALYYLQHSKINYESYQFKVVEVYINEIDEIFF